MNEHEKTPVIFRKYPNGEVIALFPTMPISLTSSYACNSYMRVGQHSAADYLWVVENTRPAKPDEWKSLYEELESIGYVMRVYTRYTAKMRAEFEKELQEWRKMLEEE